MNILIDFFPPSQWVEWFSNSPEEPTSCKILPMSWGSTSCTNSVLLWALQGAHTKIIQCSHLKEVAVCVFGQNKYFRKSHVLITSLVLQRVFFLLLSCCSSENVIKIFLPVIDQAESLLYSPVWVVTGSNDKQVHRCCSVLKNKLILSLDLPCEIHTGIQISIL